MVLYRWFYQKSPMNVVFLAVVHYRKIVCHDIEAEIKTKDQDSVILHRLCRDKRTLCMTDKETLLHTRL